MSMMTLSTVTLPKMRLKNNVSSTVLKGKGTKFKSKGCAITTDHFEKTVLSAAQNSNLEDVMLMLSQLFNPRNKIMLILSQVLYLLNLLIAGSIRRRRPNRTLFAGGGLAWQ
jgi:hypothetical protein